MPSATGCGVGIDALTTSEAGRERASNADQLAWASNVGRVLYSANIRDFDRINRVWLAAGREHAGIILLPQQSLPVGEQLRRLVLCLALEPAAIRNALRYLSR